MSTFVAWSLLLITLILHVSADLPSCKRAMCRHCNVRFIAVMCPEACSSCKRVFSDPNVKVKTRPLKTIHASTIKQVTAKNEEKGGTVKNERKTSKTDITTVAQNEALSQTQPNVRFVAKTQVVHGLPNSPRIAKQPTRPLSITEQKEVKPKIVQSSSVQQKQQLQQQQVQQQQQPQQQLQVQLQKTLYDPQAFQPAQVVVNSQQPFQQNFQQLQQPVLPLQYGNPPQQQYFLTNPSQQFPVQLYQGQQFPVKQLQVGQNYRVPSQQQIAIYRQLSTPPPFPPPPPPPPVNPSVNPFQAFLSQSLNDVFKNPFNFPAATLPPTDLTFPSLNVGSNEFFQQAQLQAQQQTTTEAPKKTNPPLLNQPLISLPPPGYIPVQLLAQPQLLVHSQLQPQQYQQPSQVQPQQTQRVQSPFQQVPAQTIIQPPQPGGIQLRPQNIIVQAPVQQQRIPVQPAPLINQQQTPIQIQQSQPSPQAKDSTARNTFGPQPQQSSILQQQSLIPPQPARKLEQEQQAFAKSIDAPNTQIEKTFFPSGKQQSSNFPQCAQRPTWEPCISKDSANERFRRCCEPLGAGCLPLCSYDSKLAMIQLSVLTGRCELAKVSAMLACASGDQDATNCCEDFNVFEPGFEHCRPYCNPKGGLPQSGMLSEKFKCLGKLTQIQQCFYVIQKP